ncbi:MAG: hypothetical protein IKQ01_00640 [Bacteroidales bacterium]|jgi:peptidoglycan/LPS O-acetylase OafA/YrhL|nr:hypothetical protein [Bacteroidales bacterium]
MKEANEKRETRPWKILELILFVVSLVLFGIVFAANPQTTDAPSLNPFLYWIYALVVLAICVTLLFPLFAAFKNKKKLLRLILLIVAIVVIVGGAFLLAPGNAIDVNTPTTPRDFKIADAVLFVTYLAVGGAIVALIWSAIRNAVKK